MNVSVKCKKCGQTLSMPLEPVKEQFSPEFIDKQNIIPQGHYWIAHDLGNDLLTGHIIINLQDRKNLSTHSDPLRNLGCCGKDGCNGPNLICTCGSEVATECSDCWTSFYIHFEPLKIDLVTA